MADVHHNHPPINEYNLYHPALPSTADYLKKSFVVSDVELLPLGDDDSAAIPRTLPSELEVDAFSQKRHEGVVPGAEVEVNFGQHLVLKDQLEPIQDQEQEQLTLLTSINEQTTSLLQTYSQSQTKSEDGDADVLEQALVLGQIALVLASSLTAVPAASGDDRVECRLAAHPEAQAEVQAQAQVQTEVVVALANMGTALVKQFDRTGDRRDLQEAGGLYGRAVVVGRGRELRVERGKTRGIGKGKRKWELGRQEDEGDGGGEEEEEDGDEPGEVFVRLEKLEEWLGERGFVV